MANLFTLIAPLAFTFAVATWGPLSVRDRERITVRPPSPCKD
jgi:hypothetical protein